MKNKLLYMGLAIVLQAMTIAAMDGSCDRKSLDSAAERYVLCIKNKEKIDPIGITKDLQFLSPEAIKSPFFEKYTQENSFEFIARQAIVQDQEEAVKYFKEAHESITDALLRLQLCLLLDKVILNLRPSVAINMSTHPILQPFAQNPAAKLSKLLLPSLDK